jgi:hypothetical protein
MQQAPQARGADNTADGTLAEQVIHNARGSRTGDPTPPEAPASSSGLFGGYPVLSASSRRDQSDGEP